jgi:hypothetical protein
MKPKPSVVAILIAIAPFAILANASQYSNSEFRFVVGLPPEAPTCRSQAPEHDGGINIFLDSGPDGCEELQRRPFIGVYASYNAMLAPTAKDVLKLALARPSGRLGRTPRHLQINGRKSAASRWDRDDGWIDIRVVSQGGKWPSEAEDRDKAVPYVNYTVMLHTTPKRLEEDVARLRAVLRDVRISQPDESQANR